jgi:hypothetical protein
VRRYHCEVERHLLLGKNGRALALEWQQGRKEAKKSRIFIVFALTGPFSIVAMWQNVSFSFDQRLKEADATVRI